MPRAAPKYAGDGFPHTAGVTPDADSRKARRRLPVELESLARPPVEVAMHRHERGTVVQPAEDTRFIASRS